LLGLILALTVPAPVLAQSAGDDQYVDPFQNDGTEDDAGSNNSGSQGGSETTTPDTSAEGGDGTATAGADASGGDSGSLPNTGLMIGGVAIAGVTLFLGGAALRRRA
jgi:hypothetical protein